MEKIRFGILGCGGIAKRFAKALALSENGILAAAAARDEARAKAFAENYYDFCGILPRFYGSYDELIADPQIDAIYIATIHPAHAALAKACILAGKPVICEKPFFCSVEEAKEIISLAEEKQVLTMEAFWTRCAPAYQKVKEWIDTGRIGDVRLLRTAFCYAFPYSEELKTHRVWDPEKGGGAMLDIGVYTYEYTTGLLGSPEKVSYEVQYAPTGVDATVTMTLVYPKAMATLLTSVVGSMDDTAYISGDAGYIRQYRFYGSTRCELYNRRDELVEVFEDPQKEGFVHEIEHFVKLLREGKTQSDLIPLKDNLEFIRLAEPIWKGTAAK